MIQDAFWGILIPFLGTSLGAGYVFFLRNSLRDGIQRALTGFAAGVDVYKRQAIDLTHRNVLLHYVEPFSDL